MEFVSYKNLSEKEQYYVEEIELNDDCEIVVTKRKIQNVPAEGTFRFKDTFDFSIKDYGPEQKSLFKTCYDRIKKWLNIT